MKKKKTTNAPLPNLKALRDREKITQEQLAEASGVSLRTIQRIESGFAASMTTARKLANALGEPELTVLMGTLPEGAVDKQEASRQQGAASTPGRRSRLKNAISLTLLFFVAIILFRTIISHNIQQMGLDRYASSKDDYERLMETIALSGDGDDTFGEVVDVATISTLELLQYSAMKINNNAKWLCDLSDEQQKDVSVSIHDTYASIEEKRQLYIHYCSDLEILLERRNEVRRENLAKFDS